MWTSNFGGVRRKSRGNTCARGDRFTSKDATPRTAQRAPARAGVPVQKPVDPDLDVDGDEVPF